MLDQSGVRATFFVLGDVAHHAPDLVRRLVDEGHEIGTHGMRHRFVYRQTPESFREDLLESIDALAGLVEQPVDTYRAPYFSITRASLWALPILQAAGIRYDSSIFPAWNHRYGIPGAERLPHQIRPGLWEWPVSPVRTLVARMPYAGGVYFRFLPWTVVRRIVRHVERRAEPVMFYLHPWELDPEQPRHRSGSRFLDFRHYFGLHCAAGKLRRLLEMARFTTLRDGFAMLGTEVTGD